MRISDAARTGAVNGIVDTIDVGAGTAKLQLRTGAAPASITDPAAGTLLVEFDLPNPAFGAGAAGVASAAGLPIAAVGVAAGDVGHARVIDRAGDPVEDTNSVGTAATEIIVSTLTVSVGLDVELTGWTITQPAGTP